jgi:hypothetical protein
VSIGDGVIDNQDRDRDVGTLSLNGSYQFSTNMAAFVAYDLNSVDYDQAFDRNGYARGGEGSQFNAGLSRQITGKLDASVFASYNERSFDDPLLPDVTGWAGGADLRWKATALTTVTGSISSGIEDTTTQWASGYLRTLYQLRVDHELLRFVQVSGYLGYSDNDYQLLEGAPPDARSNDTIFRAGVGVNWFINRYLFLSASYDYEKFDSSIPGDGFEVNRVWLQLGIER